MFHRESQQSSYFGLGSGLKNNKKKNEQKKKHYLQKINKFNVE